MNGPGPSTRQFVAWAVRNGRALWIAALLLAVPATWRTVTLYARLNGNIEALLPRKAPSVLALEELRARMDGLQYLGVIIDTGTAANLGAGERLIDDLANTRRVDRADEAVSHLYDPLHPAVMRLLSLAIGTAKKAKGLQTLLGEHQDAVVAAGYLARLGAAAGANRNQNGFTYGVLMADELHRAAGQTVQAKDFGGSLHLTIVGT